MIRYVKRTDIDVAKWNACIDAASNGLIYAYTFYLDAMCATWDALVLDDYRAVMPLPWRKKWNVCYLYHPFAVAQLGLFSNHLSHDLLHGFLKNIPAQFQYWDLPLNFENVFDVPDFPLYKRKNFVLPLQQSYEALRKNYRLQLQRNIRKAVAQQCTVQQHNDPDPVIQLAKTHAANWGTETDFENFKTLYQLLLQQGNAITYAVYAATGTVLASAVFFFSHNRAYYILPGNHKDGRAIGASHLLIDAFIKDHAGQKRILDFEGSDVPGLQFFYSSFGAVEEPYTAIRYNRLPWYAKWLKR
jgi:hypothetical protein